MATYFPGDTVYCKIGYGKIWFARSQEFEHLYSFDIICGCGVDYLVFVPWDLYLKNSFTLSYKDCEEFGLAKKFIDTNVHHITDKHIVSVRSRLDGMICSSCSNFSHMAQPNMPDEKFICWACEKYPHYK